MERARTFLLTWNPRRWRWDDYAEEARRVSVGGTVRRQWSIGVRRDLPLGSRLFLLRQGEEPRGVIGSGHAVTPVAEAPHYAPDRAANGDMRLAVGFEFDRLLDVAVSPPLPRGALEAEPFRQVNWSTQGGGIAIPHEVASALERAWADHLGIDIKPQFVVGALYTRFDILARLGMPVKRGGDPFTGYFRSGREFFLFPTIGEAGATGHNYDNGWEGDVLRWYAKNDTRLSHPIIQQMLSDEANVHIFAREHQREPFRYEGFGRAVSFEDQSPVLIRWSVSGRSDALARSPVVHFDGSYREGARQTVTLSKPERDPLARAACIAHHGDKCCVCGFDFGVVFGPLGEGYIHVHHLDPLGQADREREVDPVHDLRPVCPNCHAMLHRRDPPIAIDELRDLLRPEQLAGKG